MGDDGGADQEKNPGRQTRGGGGLSVGGLDPKIGG